MIEPPLPQAPTPRLPLFAVALLALLFGFAGFIFLGIPAQVANGPLGMWVTEVFVFFGIPALLLRATGRAPLPTLGLSRLEPRPLAFGLAVGAANYAAWAVPLMFCASRLFPPEVMDQYNPAAVFEHRTPIEMALMLSAVSLAAPVCEEVFFRGTLQQGLATQFGAIRSVVLTALIFSLLHFDKVGFVARVELGLIFGLLFLRSRSLSAGIGAHMANNLVSSAAYFASGTDTEGELPWQAVAGLALVGNAALAGLWLSSKRWPGALVSQTPATETPAPSRSLQSLVLPWLLAAAGATGALFALDPKGAALNLVDATLPLARLKPDAGADERAARDALDEVRAEARRGERTVEEYRAQRREAAAGTAAAH